MPPETFEHDYEYKATDTIPPVTSTILDPDGAAFDLTAEISDVRFVLTQDPAAPSTAIVLDEGTAGGVSITNGATGEVQWSPDSLDLDTLGHLYGRFEVHTTASHPDWPDATYHYPTGTEWIHVGVVADGGSAMEGTLAGPDATLTNLTVSGSADFTGATVTGLSAGSTFPIGKTQVLSGGGDLADAVSTALGNGYRYIHVYEPTDGSAWSWDSDISVDTTDSFVLDIAPGVVVEYPGSGVVLELDSGGSVTDKIRPVITGGEWTATGPDPTGWLRIIDTYGTVVSPDSVHGFENTTNDGFGVSVENHNKYSEQTQILDTRLEADYGIRYRPSSDTGNLAGGTESFHESRVINTTIKATVQCLDTDGNMDWSVFRRNTFRPAANNITLVQFDHDFMRGGEWSANKFEDAGNNFTGCTAIDGDVFYGPLITEHWTENIADEWGSNKNLHSITKHGGDRILVEAPGGTRYQAWEFSVANAGNGAFTIREGADKGTATAVSIENQSGELVATGESGDTSTLTGLSSLDAHAVVYLDGSTWHADAADGASISSGADGATVLQAAIDDVAASTDSGGTVVLADRLDPGGTTITLKQGVKLKSWGIGQTGSQTWYGAGLVVEDGAQTGALLAMEGESRLDGGLYVNDSGRAIDVNGDRATVENVWIEADSRGISDAYSTGTHDTTLIDVANEFTITKSYINHYGSSNSGPYTANSIGIEFVNSRDGGVGEFTHVRYFDYNVAFAPLTTPSDGHSGHEIHDADVYGGQSEGIRVFRETEIQGTTVSQHAEQVVLTGDVNEVTNCKLEVGSGQTAIHVNFATSGNLTDTIITDNKCQDTSGGGGGSVGVATTNVSGVVNSEIDGNRWKDVDDEGATTAAHEVGVSLASGGGTIAHGLLDAPTGYQVTPETAGVVAQVTAADATNLTVNLDDVTDGSDIAGDVAWRARTGD